MKIAWAAMAVATMLAITAMLWSMFGRPAAPNLAATGPWPRSLCDSPPTGARGTGRPLPGYRLYFEGMSKLVGGCHPADPESGVAMVERAFARGLPGAFAVSFADALIAQGRRDDAARWLGQAAIAAIDWRAQGFDAFGVPLPASSGLRAEIARLREAFRRADAPELESELAAALARKKLPIDARHSLEQALIARLFAVDPAAANYWYYRAERSITPQVTEFDLLNPNLSIAAECGHMAAFGELAVIFFNHDLNGSESEAFLNVLRMFRDLGRDVERFVERAREIAGPAFDNQDDAKFRAWYSEHSEKTCREWFARQRSERYSPFRTPPVR